MYKRIIFFASLISLLFAACIDEFNANLGEADQNILVVDGNIYSDSTCIFRLSLGLGITEELGERDITVNDARVAVIGTDGSRYESTSNTSGIYYVPVGSLASSEKYWLEIVTDGVTFTSEPSFPIDAPRIDSVFFAQPRADEQVDIMLTNEALADNKTGYYRWTYSETWELIALYRPKYEYNPLTDKVEDISQDRSRGWCRAKSRDLIIANSSKFEGNRINGFRLYSINGTDQRLSVLYHCEVKQYAMSRAQYEYELARKELSSEMGGMFAPQPSELFSNITASDKNHRAIGYVGVCGHISTYSFWIPTYAVHYTDIVNRSIRVLDDPEFLSLPYSVLYNIGYRIIDEVKPEMEPWQWTVRSGVDVSAFGANFIKPDFWPR